MERGIAVCGSGVVASITAHKVAGIRSTLIPESYSAHPEVEDDDMYLLCLGRRVGDYIMAWERIQIYLAAHPD